MSSVHIEMNEKLSGYLREVSLREPDLLRRLRQETSNLPNARMQITPEQGQFMSLLIQILGARKALEVGVFTGYSAISVASALAEGGRLTACDVSEEYTAIARRYWKEAGLEDRIELRLGPAAGTLDGLISNGAAGTFDFTFIDADKPNYDNYYERALVLLRTGGVLAIDNVLWHGSVADPSDNEPDTVALRALNRKVHADARVSLSMLPLGDGLTLARKR